MMFKRIRSFACLGLTLAIAIIGITTSSYAATDIYVVRHAETLGNLTHHHSHENDRTLSPEGNRQVEALTRKLDQMHFDHIIVSPKYRVLKTILPYLKKHRLVAEIWPELAECCWQKHRDLSSGSLKRGSQIRLESAMKPYFTFADADDHFSYDTKGYGQGIAQILLATDRIKQRFAGSDKRILIVDHYHAGSRIIEILQGQQPTGRYRMSNTEMMYLQETDSGTFSLVSD